MSWLQEFILQLFPFHMQLLSSRPIAQNVTVCDLKNMLENYFRIVLFSLITDSNWIVT